MDSILASVRGEGLAAGLARLPFDIARAVNDTIGEMAPLLREHPLRRAGTWESLVGVGDEGRFRQVLEHLLENEVKYSPEGGSVRISVSLQDKYLPPGLPKIAANISHYYYSNRNKDCYLVKNKYYYLVKPVFWKYK